MKTPACSIQLGILNLNHFNKLKKFEIAICKLKSEQVFSRKEKRKAFLPGTSLPKTKLIVSYNEEKFSTVSMFASNDINTNATVCPAFFAKRYE